MNRSKWMSSAVVIGSLAVAPIITFAQTHGDSSPHAGGTRHGHAAPKPTDAEAKVKKAKKKGPARPPHEDEKSANPLPPVEPHVPGSNPPPPPGSPPAESM